MLSRLKFSIVEVKIRQQSFEKRGGSIFEGNKLPRFLVCQSSVCFLSPFEKLKINFRWSLDRDVFAIIEDDDNNTHHLRSLSPISDNILYNDECHVSD